MNLYPAVICAAVFVFVAMCDFVAFDYLSDNEDRGDPRSGRPSWITTPEGRIACQPGGAIFVVLKRLWMKYK